MQKVIFLPAQNQTVQNQMAQAETYGEGPSKYGANASGQTDGHDYGIGQGGMQNAVNARMVENI